jgi:exodeoxyribonuclease III
LPLKIATWNINSVRLREETVLRLLREEAPDILCLQETKSPVEKLPRDGFAADRLHPRHRAGRKGLQRRDDPQPRADRGRGAPPFLRPLRRAPRRRAARRRHGDPQPLHPGRRRRARPGGEPEVPAQARLPRRSARWFAAERPHKAILVGDLNIAPREDDVWNHKQLLKIVSHTPVETEGLNALQAAGHWVDVTRKDIPHGRLYSWWSYRSPDWDAADKGRRLDHIWATPDLAGRMGGSRIARHVRGWDQPSDHAPVFAELDP